MYKAKIKCFSFFGGIERLELLSLNFRLFKMPFAALALSFISQIFLVQDHTFKPVLPLTLLHILIVLLIG